MESAVSNNWNSSLEEQQRGLQGMQGLFDDLLGDDNEDNECLGQAYTVDNVDDLDFMLAQKMQAEEEAAYQQWQDMLKGDEELARRLQEEEDERRLIASGEQSMPMDEDDDGALLVDEEKEKEDREFALSLLKSSAEKWRNDEVTPDNDLAVAILEAEKNGFPDEDASMALVRRLQEEEEGRLLARKLQEERDAALAAKLAAELEAEEKAKALQKKWEQEDSTQIKSDEQVAKELAEQFRKEEEAAKAAAAAAKAKAAAAAKAKAAAAAAAAAKHNGNGVETVPKPPIHPAPPSSLAKSLDATVELEIEEHSEFLGDTTSLRNFLKQYGKLTVRKVIKPELEKRFRDYWIELKKQYGATSPEANPVLSFHGTKSHHMASIEEKGLLVPGSNGVSHATDSGWWGKGIYVSPSPTYSLGYSNDGKLIVCAVLLGRCAEITQRMDGKPCLDGFDSHVAERGQEYVLFKACQVLPVFVVDTRSAKSTAPSKVKPMAYKKVAPYKPGYKKKAWYQFWKK